MTDSPNPAPEQGADDLDILFPERQIRVGGRPLTVREYSFKESLEHHDLFQPLIEAVRALMQGEEPPKLEHILAEMATCQRELIALVALATDTDTAFIESLNQSEGQRLLLLWWMVNSPFLLDSAVLYTQVEWASKAGKAATAKSSQG